MARATAELAQPCQMQHMVMVADHRAAVKFLRRFAEVVTARLDKQAGNPPLL
jgi:ABC-type uncharacterized transport system ATPase subunit